MKMFMVIDEKNTYTKLYPNRTMEKGKKSGKPKTGENKILVIDANFKQSTNVLLAKFWHAVFGLANDGNSVTYV